MRLGVRLPRSFGTNSKENNGTTHSHARWKVRNMLYSIPLSFSVCRAPETCAKHFSAPKNLDKMRDTEWVSVEGTKGEMRHKGFEENSPFMCLNDHPFDLQLRKVLFISEYDRKILYLDAVFTMCKKTNKFVRVCFS